MRVIFAGTPEFAVPTLQALLAHHEVVAVYTQPDKPAGRGKKLTAPPVKTLAEEKQIAVYQPTSLRDQVEPMRRLNADVMIVVAYGMLLPQSILDIPRLGCLNIHASILPRWRGAAPIQRAIQAGDAQTGVSIMQMEAGLDTGPVFRIARTAIEPQDNSASLHDRLARLGAEAIVETLRQLERDPTYSATPQDDAAATHAAKISKQEARLDWQHSALTLHNQIRAFNPWPVCDTHYQGERIRIRSSQVLSASDNAGSNKPGQILNATDQGIDVVTGDGILRLLNLQRDGSRALPVEEFLRGFAMSVGSHFD